METDIRIQESDGNLVADIYVNKKWFKQIVLEGNSSTYNITEVLNCVADTLERDEDYNIA